MQAAADAVKSGMVSVIGLDSAAVAALCAAATERVGADKPVQIANYLCPGNYAVSGSEEVRPVITHSKNNKEYFWQDLFS